MQKWEYRTEIIDREGNFASGEKQSDGSIFQMWYDLDELGQEGWELVAVVHISGEESMGYFKRPYHPKS